MFWCCSFHETKSKEETKRKKETKTRNQKKAKNKDKKEGRKKREIERETRKEKVKKGEAKKGSGETTRETLKNKQECRFWGKTGFSIKNKGKEQKKLKTQKKQKQWILKEGLGPSEVVPKNELFSYQSNFYFLGGCPNFPFLDNLAQKKGRTPKTL